MRPISNERRKVARYMTKLDIDIVLEDGTILPVQTHDISLNGIQFICDSQIANEIEPRGLQSHSLDRIKVKIIARFPTDELTVAHHGQLSRAMHVMAGNTGWPACICTTKIRRTP